MVDVLRRRINTDSEYRGSDGHIFKYAVAIQNDAELYLCQKAYMAYGIEY
jgi:hypothetical protein